MFAPQLDPGAMLAIDTLNLPLLPLVGTNDASQAGYPAYDVLPLV
ncbi:MAG: hypothetical protein P8P84_19435 [Paracoccaceae bacterium]|nr:hypothetical protein [Paracoccaceae bacterium]